MTNTSPNSFVLVDTGIISRFFLNKPQIVKAYNELVTTAVPIMPASVYIELMRWLTSVGQGFQDSRIFRYRLKWIFQSCSDTGCKDANDC